MERLASDIKQQSGLNSSKSAKISHFFYFSTFLAPAFQWITSIDLLPFPFLAFIRVFLILFFQSFPSVIDFIFDFIGFFPFDLIFCILFYFFPDFFFLDFFLFFCILI